MAEIGNAVDMAPQLAALLSWEQDVQSATRSTLTSLTDLVPSDERTSDRFPSAVDVVLSRLAISAVGVNNVNRDPRAALNSCLGPILADRIASQTVDNDVDLWRRAITAGEAPPLPPSQSGQINRMLHVALPETGNILPTDWGAVVEFPLNWEDDNTLRSQFGLSGSELINCHFKISPQFVESCRPHLLRIGAPCDFAQTRPGPITYLLTLEVPHDVGHCGKLPHAIWPSPLLSLDGDRAFKLLVSTVFPWTTLPTAAVHWRARYRLREQVLMQLVHSFGTHSTRPGYITVP